MRNSEVFENYAAIARELGLISEGESYDPRVGSDDLSTIEMLYGVKPNGKDEKDIIDQAHPEPVIIAPSYDRLNGLVENGKEQQNIMIGIIRKDPQAKLTQHRYASVTQELNDELIRLGFKMDNQDEDELRILADTCAENMRKQAWIPLAIGGVAAGLSLIYMLQNHAYTAQGIHNDCQKTMNALNKLLASSPEYESQIRDYMDGLAFVQQLNDSIEQARASLPSLDKVTHPETLPQAAELSQSAQGANGMKLVQQWGKVIQQFIKDSVEFMNLLATVKPKEDLSSDWWAGLKKLWHKVSPNDVAEVFRTLIGRTAPLEKGEVVEDGLLGELQNSVAEMMDSQRAIQSYVNNNKSKIVEHLQKAMGDTTAPAPTAPVPEKPKALVDKLKELT